MTQGMLVGGGVVGIWEADGTPVQGYCVVHAVISTI